MTARAHDRRRTPHVSARLASLHRQLHGLRESCWERLDDEQITGAHHELRRIEREATELHREVLVALASRGPGW